MNILLALILHCTQQLESVIIQHHFRQIVTKIENENQRTSIIISVVHH